jgi:ribosomal protein L31E
MQTSCGWPDGIACYMETDAVLLSAASNFKLWKHGEAKVSISLKVQEAKDLLVKLQMHIDEYEHLNQLAP